MPRRTCPAFAPAAPRGSWSRHRFRKDVAEQGQGRAADGQPGADQRGAASSRRSASRISTSRRSRCPTRADDVRVRPRGAARVRHAAVEGPEDREAGARVHRRRRRSGVDAAFWPAAAGWCRSTGRPSRATTSPRTSPSSTATQVLSSADEEVIRLRPELSFRDGKIEGFDKLMAGVRAGETRAAGRGPSATTRRQRGPARPEGHGDLRGAGSQEAASCPS